MFGIINRLLFGGEDKTPESVKSGEVVDDGWLVVNPQEVMSAEDQKVAPSEHQPNSAAHGDTVSQQETDTSVADPEPVVQSGNTSTPAGAGTFCQPKVLPEVTQFSCIQKAKAWAERHHTSRNGIQRQNRVRQGIPQHSFHLQQPGQRRLGH